MNTILQERLSDFPFIDFDDMNAIAFTVFKEDGQYNLMIDMMYIGGTNDDSKVGYGYTTRTAIFRDNLVELAVVITSLLELGIYDNLVFLEDSNCFDDNGDTSFEFSWNDYMNTPPTIN